MDLSNLPYIYVDDETKLIEVLSYLSTASVLGIDTETTGLDPLNDKIRLLQIADGEHPVAVIDMTIIPVEKLKELFQSQGVKVFQNAKFDIKFLLVNGFNISGPIFDTMLAAQIVRDNKGPFSFGLENLASYYLDIRLPKDEQKSDWGARLTKEQIEYAARDAAILLPLRERLIKEIKKGNLIEVCKLEFDCVWAVVDMELSGMNLDMKKWGELQEKYKQEQRNLSLKLQKELGNGGVQMNIFGEELTGGINLDSQTQIKKALKAKGIEMESTSYAELLQYKDSSEVIQWLIDYRRVSKAIQGFLSPIPEWINPVSLRIHSSYRQIGSQSGRFSCGNPNIQQIPRGKEFRECFVPERGHKFVIADYSQIELRVAAEIAKDETMLEAYKKGQDLHALTASLMANKNISEITKSERQAAKAVNFGLIYAMGAKGLQGYAKTVYGTDMTLQEAEIFRERFFKAYKGIASWHARMKKEVNVTESRTLSGRRCVYSEEPFLTALLNIPVQGTAADINKKALALLVPAVKSLKGKIVASVHDEIILEVEEDKAERAAFQLKSIMEKAGAYYLRFVPVIAEATIADSWAEK
jgi:DNA polymerase I-like protein with 3'-5' exonuclease and polymerase domains